MFIHTGLNLMQGRQTCKIELSTLIYRPCRNIEAVAAKHKHVRYNIL